jgi:DNA-binding transcriptional ArsR family regulator
MQVFAALADPTRRQIVELLAQRNRLSVAHINAQFHVSAPAISQHLRVLREAKLVRVEARAQQRLYSLDPDGVGEIEHWVQTLHQQWTDRFDALDRLLLQEMKKAKSAKKERKP